MNKATKYTTLMIGCAVLAGCFPQNTPSMVNTSRAELVSEGLVDQVPLKHVNDGYLSMLASQYGRYGEGPVDLTMMYDPASKTNTAMRAVNELGGITEKLRRKGIHNVRTATLPMNGQAEMMLMVSYDTVSAQGPSNCGTMQGLEDGRTDRDLGNYRFGCSVEQMLARQVSRPADLRGRGTADAGDGRRAANVSEAYGAVTVEEVKEPLESFSREDISE